MSDLRKEGGLSPKPAATAHNTAPKPRKSKTKWGLVPLLIIALTIVSLLALRGYRQEQSLRDVLQRVRAGEDAANYTVDAYYDLEAADQLLFEGRYQEARRAYERLASDTSHGRLNSAFDLEARLDHLGLLNSYAYELDTLRQLAGRPPRQVLVELPTRPRVAAVAPLALETTRPSQYDSLNFALRKSEMRIRSLEGRLRQNSGGNYLTFESARGSAVYYVGDVRDGRANGNGVALLSTGSRYQGEWRDNRRHGQGTFYWPDGAYYEGAYVDDERDGQGTYHFPDGSMFVGDWEADLRNGRGIYYDKDGEIVARGTWDDDELVVSEKDAG